MTHALHELPAFDAERLRPIIGSAPKGSIIHLLRGWAKGLPVAIIVGPHPPLYLYRDGRCELLDEIPPRSNVGRLRAQVVRGARRRTSGPEPDPAMTKPLTQLSPRPNGPGRLASRTRPPPAG
jgi:hypothetical protein